MARRMILMLGVVSVLLTALGFVKFRQVQSAVQAGAAFQPPPEAVTSVVARQERWTGSMNMIGSVEAVHGVTVKPIRRHHIAHQVSRSVPTWQAASSESRSSQASQSGPETCSSNSIPARNEHN